MGSDESHFNVSVGNDGQSHRTVSTNYNLFEEKGEPKRYRTEVLPPARRGRTRGLGPFCFTSTEARWLIGGGGMREAGGGGGTKEWRLDREYRPKKTERPWTAVKTTEVLRRCPLAIAQRLVHCAIAVSTAVLGQSHKDNVRCIVVEQQLEAKEVQLLQPSSTSLLMISSGLTWMSSSTSLL